MEMTSTLRGSVRRKLVLASRLVLGPKKPVTDVWPEASPALSRHDFIASCWIAHLKIQMLFK